MPKLTPEKKAEKARAAARLLDEEHAKTLAHLLAVKHRTQITTKQVDTTIRVELTRKDDERLEALRTSFEGAFNRTSTTDYFRRRIIKLPWGEIKIAPRDQDIKHGRFRRTPTDVLVEMKKPGFAGLVRYHLRKIQEQ